MVGKVRDGAYAVKGRYFDKFLLDTAGKNELRQLEMKVETVFVEDNLL